MNFSCANKNNNININHNENIDLMKTHQSSENLYPPKRKRMSYYLEKMTKIRRIKRKLHGEENETNINN